MRGTLPGPALEQVRRRVQHEPQEPAVGFGQIERALEGAPGGGLVAAERIPGDRLQQERRDQPGPPAHGSGAIQDRRERGGRRVRIVLGEPQRRGGDTHLAAVGFALSVRTCSAGPVSEGTRACTSHARVALASGCCAARCPASRSAARNAAPAHAIPRPGRPTPQASGLAASRPGSPPGPAAAAPPQLPPAGYRACGHRPRSSAMRRPFRCSRSACAPSPADAAAAPSHSMACSCPQRSPSSRNSSRLCWASRCTVAGSPSSTPRLSRPSPPARTML